jgi:ABC-type transport system involved in cytochrome c biogenesis permease subunit
MKQLLPLVLTVALVTLAGVAQAQDEATAAPQAPRWSPESLAQFAELPVQDGGRVKPLDTFAQFLLLRINGKRSFTTESGEKLDSLEWLLNVLFYPEVTKSYRHFLVDSPEPITAMGIEAHDKKRDRYSFLELEPGIPKLMSLADQYGQIETAKRQVHQQQIVNLANNVYEFQLKMHFLDFARQSFTAAPDSAIGAALPASTVRLSTLLTEMPAVMEGLRAKSMAGELDQAALEREVAVLGPLFNQAKLYGEFAQGIALLPNLEADQAAWLTPAEVVTFALEMDQPDLRKVPMLANLENLAVNRQEYLEMASTVEMADDPAMQEALRDQMAEHETVFAAELTRFHDLVVGLAGERGEYAKVPLEVTYYNLKLLTYALALYILSFLLVAISWMTPGSRWLHKLIPVTVTVPTILLIAAITIRCIIRERPPVTTLYETLLFITAVAVTVALFIEWMNRQRIAVAMGAILGSLGLFLANKYEMKEAVDTMPSLVAVLDTNFWLATHVTTVTIGYAAGLLAAALAHIYLFGRLFGLKKGDKQFYKSLSRMIYGVVCFCLLFATVGTVLGGIWANDSWGRFWGWDPKENGALLIVLWSLMILHARMGGYIRDLGIAVSSVVLGMIVAFSWWGVNLLGVGLHSYGFTSGIWTLLMVFWASETVVACLGLLLWVLGRQPASKPALKPATARK